MAEKIIVSKKGYLKWRDGLRALGLAVSAAVVERLIELLNSGDLTLAWKPILVTALSTGLVYILKNWLVEPTSVTTTYKSDEKAVKVAKHIENETNK